MKLKCLKYGALLFLLWGFYAQESLLYYFFAIHLGMLSVGVFFHQKESAAKQDDTDDPASDST